MSNFPPFLEQRYRQVMVMLRSFGLFFISLFSLLNFAFASSVETVTYNGRLINPSGAPLEAASVAFTLKIYDPTENCVLYSENQTLNMTASNGAFSLVIGEGTRTDGGAHNLKRVFTNLGTLSGLSCASGSTYTAASSDDRKLVVSFNDGAGLQTLSAIAIKSVPFAMQASEVSGYGIYNLAKISGAGSAGVLSPGQYSQILALPSTNCATNEVMKWNGTAWACATDVVGASGGGITSLNGASGSVQTFATASAGLAPAFSTSGTTHTLNIPLASTASVTAGLISKSDYDTFNLKIGGATAFTGDVSGTIGANVVDKIKGKAIVPASYASGQTLRYNGTQWINATLGFADLSATPTTLAGYGITDALGSSLSSGSIWVGNVSNVPTAVPLSGDATLNNAGTLTLAATTVTGGTYGSSTAVPTFTVDSKGRLTAASSVAYANASTGSKGIVQIGSNLSVTSGTVSVTSGNVTSALGYTPVNLAGDTMSGLLVLSADPSTALGAVTKQYADSKLLGKTLPAAPALAQNNQGLRWNNTTLAWEYFSAGAVNSVGLSLPSEFSVTNSPVTSSGALTGAWASQTGNKVFASLNGATGTPGFRALANADLPVVDVTHGGSGQSSTYLANSLMFANGTGTALTIGLTCSLNQILKWNGTTWACDVDAVGVSGGGITSLNGASGSVQTFATGSAGLAPAFSTSGTTHTLNIPLASTASVTAGLISKSDYDTFNLKVGGATAFTGDVSGTIGANVVDKIKGKAVIPATYASGQTLRYNGTQWINATLGFADLSATPTTLAGYGITDAMGSSLSSGSIWVGNVSNVPTAVALSGDATLNNAGVLSLAATAVTGGTYGSSAAVPTFTVDGKGRLTAAGSVAYANAGTGNKGIVQIGSNLSVTGGTVSVTSGNVTSALGYTPVNLAGDTMSGLLILSADPSAALGAVTKQYADSKLLGKTLPAAPTLTENSQSLRWNNTTLAWEYYRAGSVSSVALSLPSEFSVTNSPVSSSGTLTGAWASQTGNKVFASLNGATGTPGFRSLDNADLPVVDVTHGGSGQSSVYLANSLMFANGTGTALTTGMTCSLNQILKWNGTTWGCTTDSLGTVTSIVAGTGLDVGAGPGGSIASTGTISLANTAVTAGSYGSASSVGTFTVDAQGRLTAAASTGITLNASAITAGILPINRGGTNSSTTLNNNRLMVSSAGSIVEMGAMTNGQILVGSTGAAPVIATMSGDASITNAGVVTVSKIQNRLIASTAPIHGQVLRWNANTSQWEPSTAEINIFKAATQSVASNTTLVNDSDFSFTALANTNYSFDVILRVSNATTGNFKFQWTLPSGTWQATGGNTNATSPVYINNAAYTFTTGAATPYFLVFHGIIQVGATGGVVNFQWAQGTSNATATQLMQGSTLSVREY